MAPGVEGALRDGRDGVAEDIDVRENDHQVVLLRVGDGKGEGLRTPWAGVKIIDQRELSQRKVGCCVPFSTTETDQGKDPNAGQA